VSEVSSRARKSFEVARRVLDLLARNDVGAAVIGSVALAVHGYVRATTDLDLGVAVLTFESLRSMAEQLRERGYDVDVGEPGVDDPLGGVVTVSGPDFDSVQIVNLRTASGRNERLARDAIETAQRIEGIDLPVVDLPHLVALKLVSGSRQDQLDVVHLLRANPRARMEDVVAVCRKHRLKKQLDSAVEGGG
jgi:hypothetical protein